MDPARSLENIVVRMTAQADAVALLAKDEGAFAAAVAAFASEDTAAFSWVLGRVGLGLRCESICEWIRVKMCVLRCTELCGVPPLETQPLDLLKFAQTIAQLGSDQKVLRRVVDAVGCGDAGAYHAALADLKLKGVCEPICHWICSTIHERICRRVCDPVPVPLVDAATQIGADAKALAAIASQRDTLTNIGNAVLAQDSARVGTLVQGSNIDCEALCRLICVWWRYRVCRELCRVEPVIFSGPRAVEEARQFALAAVGLTSRPRALADLITAAQTRDAALYGTVVASTNLTAYCWQVCAWVSSHVCFGVCSCISQSDQPLFTAVGDFSIPLFVGGNWVGGYISPTTGLTTLAQNGHGGPGFGFFNTLSLQGFCPAYFDPAQTEPMAYRYQFQRAGAATPTPITGAYVGGNGVIAGYKFVPWNGVQALQTIVIGPAASGPTPTTGPGAGPPDLIIAPDPNGWVDVDPGVLGAIFSGPLMGFDTTAAGAFPGPATPAVGTIQAPAPVPISSQAVGTNAAIIFQAARKSIVANVNSGASQPDYTNTLPAIHINNFPQVKLLNLQQFTGPGATSCTPITDKIDILYTVDHELMLSWSIALTSAAVVAFGKGYNTPPGSPTSATSVGLPQGPTPAQPRGANGTYEQTTTAVPAALPLFPALPAWPACSYTVKLYTTRALTSGLIDDSQAEVDVTFCICG